MENSNDKLRGIRIIKDLIRIMSETCSAIRTLNGVIVMYSDDSGGKLVLDLNSLKAEWDSERRPIIQNKQINYIDFKNFDLINSDKERIKIDDLDDEGFKSLKFYMEQMIPKPGKYYSDFK